MNPSRRAVLLISSDVVLAQQILDELLRRGMKVHVAIAATVAQARAHLRRFSPRAVVLDPSCAGSQPLEPVVRELARTAPVILLGDLSLAAELDRLQDLLVSTKLEIVWRGEKAESELAAAIGQRSQLPSDPAADAGAPECSLELENAPDGFGEILRHEVNNPLTGILGNAELLLARRDSLSPMAIRRLETIAELAVRLRETVRLLSNAWEARDHHVRSA